MPLDSTLNAEIMMYLFDENGRCMRAYNFGTSAFIDLDPQYITGLMAALLTFGGEIGFGIPKEVDIKWLNMDDEVYDVMIHSGKVIYNVFMGKELSNLSKVAKERLISLNYEIINYLETEHLQCISRFIDEARPFSGLGTLITNKVINIKEDIYGFYLQKIVSDVLSRNPPVKYDKLMTIMAEFAEASRECYSGRGDLTTREKNVVENIESLKDYYENTEAIHELHDSLRQKLIDLAAESRSKTFNGAIDSVNKSNKMYQLFKVPLITPQIA